MWLYHLTSFSVVSSWLSLGASAGLLAGLEADLLAAATAENTTALTDTLQTWWHDSGEINYETPVQDGNVRQSHLYSAWVKSSADSTDT
jgi:hypothetical protein